MGVRSIESSINSRGMQASVSQGWLRVFKALSSILIPRSTSKPDRFWPGFRRIRVFHPFANDQQCTFASNASRKEIRHVSRLSLYIQSWKYCNDAIRFSSSALCFVLLAKFNLFFTRLPVHFSLTTMSSMQKFGMWKLNSCCYFSILSENGNSIFWKNLTIVFSILFFQ